MAYLNEIFLSCGGILENALFYGFIENSYSVRPYTHSEITRYDAVKLTVHRNVEAFGFEVVHRRCESIGVDEHRTDNALLRIKAVRKLVR